MQCACAILPSLACPALQYISTLSHKRHDFRKWKVTEHKMCILISSTTFVWHISHSKKKWARCDKKCLMVFMSSTRYYFSILFTLEFSWQFFFQKYSNIKCHENPSIASRVVPWGQTDGQTYMKKLIFAFRNFRTPLKVHFWRCY